MKKTPTVRNALKKAETPKPILFADIKYHPQKASISHAELAVRFDVPTYYPRYAL
jgi:hypothetical protein